MTRMAFKDPQVAESFAEGLIKAGLPGETSGYYKISEENRLSGKEIRKLFFGRKVAGSNLTTGKQWWIERTKDGNASYRGPMGYVKGEVSEVGETSDTGTSWLEGDRLCNQWTKLYGGLEDCFPIYDNPEGTPEKKDQYIGVTVYGFVPFSPVR